MKTFDEAAERYTSTIPDGSLDENVLSWKRTIATNTEFMEQMRMAAEYAIVDIANSHPEFVKTKLQAYFLANVTIGIMIGIDMEKPEL